MQEQVVVGVIGAGKIGKLHIANLKQNQNVRIKMVSDLFADQMWDWFDNSGVEQITKDYHDILNDSEIDAVFICSPTNTHVELIKEAATKGKHIFCEKPISFSDEESVEAFKIVESTGVKFQIGFNRRFDKNFSAIREGIVADKIGDIHLLKITSRDPKPPELDYIKTSGGMFYDMTIHDFDMARFIVGQEIVEVYAQGGNLIDPKIGEMGDMDTAIITLKFEDGSLGVIDNSREAVYGYDQRIEVFGNKGALTADNETPTNVKYYNESAIEQDKPLYFFLERYNDAYVNETSKFIQCILNKQDTEVVFKDGMMAQRIAQAARKSYETQQPVKVETKVW